jgi:predicted secreted protein
MAAQYSMLVESTEKRECSNKLFCPRFLCEFKKVEITIMQKGLKKLLCVIICLICLFTMPLSVYSINANCGRFRLGDVNNDNNITSYDARFVLRVAARMEALDDTQSPNADVNADGKVNSTDARTILRVAAKLQCFEITVKLNIGETYVVDWLQNSATQYHWEYSVVPEIGISIAEIQINNDADDLIGKGNYQNFVVSATTPGIYQMDLKLKTSWSDNSIIEEIKLIFDVK